MLIAIGIIYASRSKRSNWLRQQVRIIGNFDPFRLLAGMNNWIFMFNQRPFKRFPGTVYIEAFPVLPCCIEKRSCNLRSKIRVSKFDMTGLNREWRIVLTDQVFADSTGS